ncbi:MAG TPA: asparagine synthase-related protein [Terracidiphilus sp.]
MIAALCHETFYVTGKWSDERSGLYVGWVAREGSFSDGMPLCNERKDVTLFFSGEEYPEPGIAASLRAKGHTIAGKPSDYLVHLAEEDPEFPKGLNGRFQGLLVDRSAGTATLFNDRYGMQRMYYHQGRGTFFFAPEAKAILAVCPELRNADPQGLGEFVSCGCVLEDRTLFHDIRILPTASKWVFQNGVLQNKSKYFEAGEWEDQDALDPETYYSQLREVFSHNLPRYFGGEERIGISLTGGLDSRMIMAWMKAEPESLPTYTFGGPFRDCEDVIVARKVAKVWQQPHQVIPLGDEFLKRFGHYAERTVYLSDGCAAVSRSPDLYLNEIVAGIAPVRMTGNYGSEILRRLRAFKPVDPAPGLFQPEFLSSVGQARVTYNAICQGHAVSFTAFKQAPWYQYGLLSLEQTQLSVRSPFLDNDLVRTAFRAPRSELMKSNIFEDSGDCSRLIADGNAALQGIPTDRGLGGATGWMPPMLRSYLEFTFKAEYAYDYGMPQWLARLDHRLSWFRLERLFLGRHKFCHFRLWYRDALSDYVKEILLDPRSLSRPYVQRKSVEAMVFHHTRGDRNYTTEITRLLTMELQHRLFLDSN